MHYPGIVWNTGRYASRLWAAAVCVAAVCCFGSPADATSRPAWCPDQLTEDWIRTQLVKGPDLIDLEGCFKESERVLKASFLVGLLTDPSYVSSYRHGVHIAHAVVSGPVDLNDSEIPHETRLIGLRFDQDVNLSMSVFRRSLDVSGSVFNGKANFSNAHFAEHLVARGARFLGVGDNDSEGANFGGIKVEGSVFVRGARFGDSVNFQFANIGGNLDARGARFLSKTNEADFDGMRVGGYARFDGVHFAGGVDFANVQITSNFDARGSQFQNTEKEVSLENMKVGGRARFGDAVFAGPVDFSYSHIGGAFFVDGARFTNPRTVTDFTGMQVAGPATFNASFAGRVALDRANFATVDFSKIRGLPDKCEQAPRKQARIAVGGMTYQSVAAGDEPGSWARLNSLFCLAPYSESAYTTLENFFRQQGSPDLANAVYIAGKERERERLWPRAPLQWLGNFLLEYSVGYGRRPWLALLWSAGFVAVGWWGFFLKREWMDAQKPEHSDQRYSPFWYSLDLFVPFVDLQVAKMWMPKQKSKIVWHYRYLHRTIGWLLIPLGVAAITGIIK